MAELFEERADIFIKSKSFDKAVEDWKKTYEVDSTYTAYANYKIGNIYLNEIRNFDQAIVYLSKSLELKYWKTQVIFSKRSIAYTNQKKYSLALKDINKAIELDPENRTYYYEKLNIFLLTNDYDNSIIEANKTIKMERSDPQGFYGLGYTMYNNKEYYKSLKYLTISIEKMINNKEGYYIGDPNGLDKILLPDLYKFRASIYEKINVPNLMCEDYNLALETQKDNAELKKEIESLILENCN